MPPKNSNPATKWAFRAGERNVERGEEISDLRQTVQLPPSGLNELPAPVEPYSEKKWGAEFFRDVAENGVETERASYLLRGGAGRAEPAHLHPVVEGRLNDGWMFGFGRGAFAECGIDGFAKRVSALQCFEEEEVFAGEAFVVDGVVVAVDRKVNLLAGRAAGTGTADEMDSDSVAGLRAGVVRGIANRKEGVVDGVGCGEETEIGCRAM